jgi:hypothetical protein
MKHITLATLALSTLVLVSCDQQKAAIDAKNESKQEAIEHRKDAIDDAAASATKQTEINADINKANIEANKDVIQAQLDADKKKADAVAAAEKARVDAQKP